MTLRQIRLLSALKNGMAYAVPIDNGPLPALGETVESAHSGLRYEVIFVGIDQVRVKSKDTKAS